MIRNNVMAVINMDHLVQNYNTKTSLMGNVATKYTRYCKEFLGDEVKKVPPAEEEVRQTEAYIEKYVRIASPMAKPMESRPSLSAKGEAKSSILKKRIDPALQTLNNSSKKKALERAGCMGSSEKISFASIRRQTDQQPISIKPSKREMLIRKSEIIFQMQIEEAQRCKIGSFCEPSPLKQNHNNIVELNQRELSPSRAPEENLSDSKAKIATECKKSKPVENGTERSKNEKKSVCATEIKEVEAYNKVNEIANSACNQTIEEKSERAQEQPEGAEEQLTKENPETEPADPKRATRKTASKSKSSKVGQDKENTDVAKDIKGNNLKRSELCKSEKEVEEEKDKAKPKRSKSGKRELRLQANSKDEKYYCVKGGSKKSKPNERWYY